MTQRLVLMVDRDGESLAAACRAAPESGYRLVTASTLSAAQARMQDSAPDLLVVDFDLPGVERLFAQRLEAKERGRPAPSMLCVSERLSGDELRRSFDWGALTSVVREQLRRRLPDTIECVLERLDLEGELND